MAKPNVRVAVISADGLFKRDLLGSPNPFAVVAIDGRQKKKTTTVRKTVNPYWNESFDMLADSPDSILSIKIFDEKKVGKEDRGFLGVARAKIGTILTDSGNDQFTSRPLVENSAFTSSPVTGKIIFSITPLSNWSRLQKSPSLHTLSCHNNSVGESRVLSSRQPSSRLEASHEASQRFVPLRIEDEFDESKRDYESKLREVASWARCERARRDRLISGRTTEEDLFNNFEASHLSWLSGLQDSEADRVINQLFTLFLRESGRDVNITKAGQHLMKILANFNPVEAREGMLMGRVLDKFSANSLMEISVNANDDVLILGQSSDFRWWDIRRWGDDERGFVPCSHIEIAGHITKNKLAPQPVAGEERLREVHSWVIKRFARRSMDDADGIWPARDEDHKESNGRGEEAMQMYDDQRTGNGDKYIYDPPPSPPMLHTSTPRVFLPERAENSNTAATQANIEPNVVPKEGDLSHQPLERLSALSLSRPITEASSSKATVEGPPMQAVVVQRSTPSDRLSSYFPTNVGFSRIYTDSEILEISSILRVLDDAWSKVPRTYIVLRAMGRLELLNDFISIGFSDYWFPVNQNSLPKRFNAKLRSEFVDAQEIILTKSIDLEKGEKGLHQHFAKRDVIPFESKGILGTGGFGQVDRVLSLISYKEYARKLIPRRAAFGSQPTAVYQSFIAEMQILKTLKHGHIVEFIGSYTDPKYLGLLMSPIAQMDLSGYLNNCSTDKVHELRTFFGCLARALEFLHDRSIRHKDIKPANILIHNGNVLFTDFGLARDFADATGSTTSGMTALSPRYCAPEVAAYDSRNTSSDIWSLGCVFLEMVVVLKGFSTDYMKEYFVKNGTQLPFIRTNFEAFSQLTTELESAGNAKDNRPLEWVRNMVKLDRFQRPSASDVIDAIVAPDEYGEHDFSFCAICCQSGDGPEASDSSDDLDEGFAEL